MGRKDEGLYSDDSALSFLEKPTDFLMKEAFYLFAPELMRPDTRWIRNALTVIEVMLIFADDEHFGAPTFLRFFHTAVRRWQEAFFRVWDADWNDTERISSQSPYSQSAYRVEQRQTVNALFERLIGLAEVWRGEASCSDSKLIIPSDLHNDEAPAHTLPPFALQDNLPMFSATHLKTAANTEYSLVGVSLYALIDMLIQGIVVDMLDADREYDILVDFEEVWLSVDVIGLLCEKYQVSPSLAQEDVQGWLDIIIHLWLASYEDGPHEVDDAEDLAEVDGQYRQVVAAFVRLMTVIRQHPMRR